MNILGEQLRICLADLHIHSRFSRATSRNCTLEGLHHWAQLKGVTVAGTGDFTHPGWLSELSTKLVPAAPGLYQLRPEAAAAADADVPDACRAPVRFMLTGEISSIYKRAGRVRKVHSLVLAPDLETVAKINGRLGAIGNLRSDGRPILGLDPRNLLEILLEASPACALIPAHIWTPWFAMLGSRSGFDSLAECFGDLAPHIFAVETGLSSDPPMNRRVRSLDAVALVSNSDLHSPANLGRNASVFLGAPDYFSMLDGLRRKDPAVCGGTIDLFPEEGKYHLDGHRACGVVCTPEESRRLGNNCPKCGQPLTLGVLHRVLALADRPEGERPPGALPCRHIIPLCELLGELLQAGAGSKKVQAAYRKLLAACGPELDILLRVPPEQLDAHGPPRIGEAIRRLRAEKVFRRGGYDGEFGVVTVFP
ncbi:MAG: endonuclease Q family protein [bacterium]